MKRTIFLTLLLYASLSLPADNIKVKELTYAGPFDIYEPSIIDSTDTKGKKYSLTELLDTQISEDVLKEGKSITCGILPENNIGTAINLLGFSIENQTYCDATVSVEGLKYYQLFVDGKKQMSGYVKLTPATHNVVIKYLSRPNITDSVGISIDCKKSNAVSLSTIKDSHRYNIMDVLHARRVNMASISPNGKYLISNYYQRRSDGVEVQRAKITDLARGKVIADRGSGIRWMPRSDKYYFTEEGIDGLQLIAIDPTNGNRETIVRKFPRNRFVFSPTEDFLIMTISTEGKAEDKAIYQITEPYDRQTDWRNRTNIARYDLKTGMLKQLTYGNHNIQLQDISMDGKKILFTKEENILTQRPSEVKSLYEMDLTTQESHVIIENDGFISNACFSPNSSQILVLGSPESFDGIGKNVKEGQIPSMYDMQLYIIDNDSQNKITPLTKDFNPSVVSYEWNKTDGMIYFTADDKDSVNFFVLNPTNRKIKKINTPEEVISGFQVAQNSPILAYYGHSASNSDRIYTLNLKNLRSALTEDISAENLHNIKLGECKPWSFTNSNGDNISCRYYLPSDFNPSARYPMIVYYYGGYCPISRDLESNYPLHVYASQGYVVLVVNPSGGIGFGQDFSARHVNTAGEGVADDIIEGTRKFCSEFSFINSDKIGCIGASYGGFITQYMLTKSDIFAAAISHAGISDHASYWGEGFWGYSYSEVSMAGNYPWTNKELFVNRSPLYNADRIHTPLLFLHGDKDTNVPVGESVQMFNALKLLGRETALVLVKDQDHHITDYQKRIKWQNTIFAWFAKYLQDDDEWWNSLYE